MQVSSVVIDRPILQEILLERVGHTVTNDAEVISCETIGDRVRVQVHIMAASVYTRPIIGAFPLTSSASKVPYEDSKSLSASR